MREVDVAVVHRPADRGGRLRLRRRRQREVALGGEEARRRVEPDPAGAGNEDLGPGVQVGEVALGAGGTVERAHVGPELDQVPGDEARGEAEVAQALHQEPAAVATRARALRERLLRCLDARLEADQVADAALQTLVQLDEEIDRVAPIPRDRSEELLEVRSGRLRSQVGTQFLREQALVGERPALGVVLDEEVERIEGHGFRDEVDGDDELAHRARKHDARLPVAERILLPVEEVGLGVDPERVRSDPGPRMRGRPQPDGLRRQGHEPVVPVRRPVMDCDLHARRAYAAGDPRRTLTDGAARHVPDP